MPALQRLYIANRGEIAVRIGRAARELQLEAVPAFDGQDPDPRAFLDVPRLLDDARRNGCDALHPGYGFLSESAALAQATADAGLTFIGPSVQALRALSDKPQARSLAARCGVPILPGTTRAVDLMQATAFVETLAAGHKAVIKASAGGGGRGMRVVSRDTDLASAYDVCSREAAAAFGDGSVYVERYVSGGRHIEVQIIGDGQDVTTLGARDCSLQHRYQKMVEVSPPPDLEAETEAAMFAAAKTMAQAIAFASLGTFEFLVDREGGFWFLEANARLQVEHTVTECVWGVDLVQAQLQLAQGRSLGDLCLPASPRGCAIELRVNAGQLRRDGSVAPTTESIAELAWPGGPGIRVDTAAELGRAPDPRFDALLGKISVWSGDGFAGALRRARRALDETVVEGPTTNLSVLRRLCADSDVAHWRVDTTLVGRALPRWGDAVASASGSEARTRDVCAPLSGTVVEVAVQAGQRVREGQLCAVIEALKLQTVVAAPHDGVLAEVRVSGGRLVAEGDVLFVVEPSAAPDPGDVDAVPAATGPRPELEELRARLAATEDHARAEAVARRHARGGRTARQNVAALCDDGSFIEYGALAIAAQRQRHDEAELRARTPADGIVTGVATINAEAFGPDRSRCVVMVYDYTVMAGTQGMTGHKKMDRMFDVARGQQLPVVLFAEGGGGRPGDTDIAGASYLDNHTFTKLARLRGEVPSVGVVNGRCFAGNAALLACCDFIVATRTTSLGMAGPAMIEGAGLGTVAADAVGPAAMHAARGTVDIVVDDEAAATEVAQRLLGYAQGPLASGQGPDPDALRDVLPTNRLRVYDMRNVVDGIFDVGGTTELGAAHGRAVITALARLEGRAIAVLASDCRHLAGALDASAARKAAALMRLAERRGLPLVVLCDTPGFMVGSDAEAEGLVADAGELFIAGAELTVPLVGVVVRKAYGLGAQALLGGGLHRPDLTVAWPTAELGAMGPEGAVRLAYRRQLAAIDDPAEREASFRAHLDAMNERGRAVNAATFFELDAVIDPARTRAVLVGGLRPT